MLRPKERFLSSYKGSFIEAGMRRRKSCHVTLKMKSLHITIPLLVYIKTSQPQITVSRDPGSWGQPFGGSEDLEEGQCNLIR